MFFSYIQAGAGNDATQTIVIVAAPWTLGWSNSPRARPQIMKRCRRCIVRQHEKTRLTGDQGTERPWIFAMETEAVAAGLIMLAVVVWKVCSGLSAANQTLTFDETLLIATVPPFKHSQHTASSCRANVGLTMCSIVGYSHATVILHNYAC